MVVSLDNMYNQIQALMDEYGVEDEDLHIQGRIVSYSHIKKGIYRQAPDRTPAKDFTVHMCGKLLVMHEPNPILCIEKAKHWLEEYKMSKEQVRINDIEIQIEDNKDAIL